MTDRKIASLKLVSGEEVVCNLLDISKEGSHTVLLFENPLRIEANDKRKRRSYSFSRWLVINNDTYHEIDVTKIITVSEVKDTQIITDYLSFFNKRLESPKARASKRIGFVGDINDFKERLEKIYSSDEYNRPES